MRVFTVFRKARPSFFRVLVSKVATSAILASKYGGQVSPGSIFERMESFLNDCCCPLDQTSFEELVLKAIKNGKRSSYGYRQNVDQVDCLKLISFQFLDDDDNCKLRQQVNQRYRMNFFFAVFHLFVLLPNSMTNLIDK